MVNLVAMPVRRGTMEKYQNRHIRQVEHATKQWEARANKVANNNHRKQWLQRQNNASYRNEYDRLNGELSRYRIPYGSVQKLKQRQNELQNLFSSGNV
jgi:acyl carrier protein phosphodiesterase